MRATTILAFILIGASPTAAPAAQSAYVLDDRASHVTFQGRALLQSIVGRSEALRGRIMMRGRDLRTARGDVRFAVTSLQTNPEMDERELADLFGGPAHPEVIFHVDSILEESPKDWRLYGDLEMRGVRRDVVFAGKATAQGSRVVAEGEAQVDMREWGIEPPARLRGLVRMGPELRLQFRAEFLARAAKRERIARGP